MGETNRRERGQCKQEKKKNTKLKRTSFPLGFIQGDFLFNIV